MGPVVTRVFSPSFKNGDKVAISTICSMLTGMTAHGTRLAREIGCPYEEQDVPDQERSR